MIGLFLLEVTDGNTAAERRARFRVESDERWLAQNPRVIGFVRSIEANHRAMKKPRLIKFLAKESLA